MGPETITKEDVEEFAKDLASPEPGRVPKKPEPSVEKKPTEKTTVDLNTLKVTPFTSLCLIQNQAPQFCI